ncbi:MAG: hypothetical protein IH943_08070 [Acidobacteria bacterium]|nr:hypothetical protein [Acidobacteriota bacterium]
MNKAVAHLEPLMEKADTGGRGKLVLATGSGDVHDIGKNLVDTILSNNGYEIHNLGIKVGISEMITVFEETNAHKTFTKLATAKKGEPADAGHRRQAGVLSEFEDTEYRSLLAAGSDFCVF